MSLLSSTPDSETGPVADDRRVGLLAEITAGLGDAVAATHLIPGKDLWVRVNTADWLTAGRFARDALGCAYFCFLSAIDWLPSPFGKGEDDPTEPPPERSTAIEQGFTGGATRFQLIARTVSLQRHVGITWKVDVPDDLVEVESWVKVYAGADWHERECWEMFGISFAGHPGLRKLYLPGGFEGHPMRKDFPLLARLVKPWPGIVDVEPLPVGADDGGEAE